MLHQPPKIRGMIEMLQMSQFVHDHGVDHPAWRAHQPGIQCDPALTRTTSPSGSQVADRDP